MSENQTRTRNQNMDSICLALNVERSAHNLWLVVDFTQTVQFPSTTTAVGVTLVQHCKTLIKYIKKSIVRYTRNTF